MKNNIQSSIAELFDSIFPPFTIVGKDTGSFTFPPSQELVQELTSNFTTAKIEKFENGPSFSSYHVDYFVGLTKCNAIYKTTTLTYPDFEMYDTVEEYQASFSEAEMPLLRVA